MYKLVEQLWKIAMLGQITLASSVKNADRTGRALEAAGPDHQSCVAETSGACSNGVIQGHGFC